MAIESVTSGYAEEHAIRYTGATQARPKDSQDQLICPDAHMRLKQVSTTNRRQEAIISTHGALPISISSSYSALVFCSCLISLPALYFRRITRFAIRHFQISTVLTTKTTPDLSAESAAPNIPI
ncbi:hypothetical protein ACTXT7_005975 [Hymenolepis weldensis]